MACVFRILKPVVTSLLVAAPAVAQEESVGQLMAQLSGPDWKSAETRIRGLWSRSGSASVDLLLRRGEEAMEAEEWGVAVEHLSAAIDHAPDFAEAYHARATALYRLKRPGQALDDLERVLSMEPRHWGALVGLGVILRDLDYPEEALVAFRAARAIHPNLEEVDDAIERLGQETAGRRL